MLIQVCLLLLSIGVYASHVDGSSESTTEDALFGELDFIFPKDFLSRFPGESEFFTTKIVVYLFFNLFAKYVGENEPIKFWSKFNHNDYNRAAIDAVFYEYLTKFADGKMKHQIFNPLESNPEDIAINRIGDYLDGLSSGHKYEIRSQATKNELYEFQLDCPSIVKLTPPFGTPVKDYPVYCEIPHTTFTCEDKLVPGIYADVETRCQVYHTCWPRRMDSFLCPVGTRFNQALLTCDFWDEFNCSSAPLFFDRSPYQDGTPTISESPSAFPPEMVIPEYDGSCQSLITEPLQLHMKFPPTKCKVTERTDGSSQNERNNQFSLAIENLTAKDILSPLILGATRKLMHTASQQPQMKMKSSTTESKSEEVQVTTESSLQNDDVDSTIEEQTYSTTPELPYDIQDEVPQQMTFEKSLKDTSLRKEKYSHSVRKSALLKPSKPSEDDIKRAFNTIIASLELGGRMLNEGLLPLVEKIVLDSHRKKANLKIDY